MYYFGLCIGCSKFILPINFIGNFCLRLHSFIMLYITIKKSEGFCHKKKHKQGRVGLQAISVTPRPQPTLQLSAGLC